MPYIKRDQNNEIIAIYKDPQPGTEELDSLSAAEILNFIFRNEPQQKRSQLEMLIEDLGFIRVLEDVVDLLIEHNVLRITDFPESALERLRNREKLRSRMSQQAGLATDEGAIL